MSESAEDRAALKKQEGGFRFAVTLAADALSLVGGPSAMLQAAAEKAIAKRRDGARNVLIEALSAGGTDFEAAIIGQVDESAAIMLRYLRAADEGARLRNLRLLARAFYRQLGRGEASAERFQQTAASIEDLSDAELDLLGTWFRFGPEQTLNELRKHLGIELEESADLYATAASLLRNGLVIPGSAFGGIAYDLSPRALRLLLDLEASDFSEA